MRRQVREALTSLPEGGAVTSLVTEALLRPTPEEDRLRLNIGDASAAQLQHGGADAVAGEDRLMCAIVDALS